MTEARKLLGWRVWFRANKARGERMYLTPNGEGLLHHFWREGLNTKPPPLPRRELDCVEDRWEGYQKLHLVPVYTRPKPARPAMPVVFWDAYCSSARSRGRGAMSSWKSMNEAGHAADYIAGVEAVQQKVMQQVRAAIADYLMSHPMAWPTVDRLLREVEAKR